MVISHSLVDAIGLAGVVCGFFAALYLAQGGSGKPANLLLRAFFVALVATAYGGFGYLTNPPPAPTSPFLGIPADYLTGIRGAVIGGAVSIVGWFTIALIFFLFISSVRKSKEFREMQSELREMLSQGVLEFSVLILINLIGVIVIGLLVGLIFHDTLLTTIQSFLLFVLTSALLFFAYTLSRTRAKLFGYALLIIGALAAAFPFLVDLFTIPTR